MLLVLHTCSEKEIFKNIEDCYHISTNNDLTYFYEVTGFKGNVLVLESAAIKEPTIKALSTSVLEVSTQTGTGLPTNWAIYCDVEAGNFSEKHTYVSGTKDDYVFYFEYKEGTHSIICQNIFDKKALM